MYYIPLSDLHSGLISLFDFNDTLVSIWSESLEDNDRDLFTNRIRFWGDDSNFSINKKVLKL